MAITFVAGAIANATNGGDVAVDLTDITGLAEDDLVVLIYGIGDSDGTDFDMGIASGSGWTEQADLFGGANAREANFGVYTKVMGATPDTTVTVDGQGGTNAAVAAVAIGFRGVDTAAPLDGVSPTTFTSSSTMDPSPASIDYTTAGCAVVIAGASGHSQGSQTVTFPTGYTTNSAWTTGNDSNDITVSLGHNLSPSDPESPGQITHSATDNTGYSSCAVTLALKPAGAAASIVPQVMNHRRLMDMS